MKTFSRFAGAVAQKPPSELLAALLCEAFEIGPALEEQDWADALEERGMVVRRSGEAVLTKAGALFLVPGAGGEFGKCYVEVFLRGTRL